MQIQIRDLGSCQPWIQDGKGLGCRILDPNKHPGSATRMTIKANTVTGLPLTHVGPHEQLVIAQEYRRLLVD